jgi:hypothetical protein
VRRGTDALCGESETRCDGLVGRGAAESVEVREMIATETPILSRAMPGGMSKMIVNMKPEATEEQIST